MLQKLTYHPFGENALLMQWRQEISPEILQEIRTLTACLRHELDAYIVDLIPAYASLTIVFDPSKITYTSLVERVNSLDVTRIELPEPKTWEIPVRYDSDDHPDVATLLQHCGITRNELVAIHTAVFYTVHFIGFLPGFLYLGGLDRRLHIPRKKVPDLWVPKGSVAIGGQQTGIYPVQSPGGWYVIGRTEMEWFNPLKPPYCHIEPGDKVRFVSI